MLYSNNSCSLGLYPVIIQLSSVPTGTIGCSSSCLGLPTRGQPEALMLNVTRNDGTQQINCREERLGFIIRYAGAVEGAPVGAFKHGFLLFNIFFNLFL